MSILQKQSDLTLVNRTGKLEIKQKSDKNGLYDIIRLQTKTKNASCPLKVAFDLDGGSFACLDKGGNGTMFYTQKNRYVNFITSTNGTHLSFIEKGNGQLAVALKNNNIAIYNNLNGKLVQTLKWHTFHIQDLQVNHLRNLLVSVSQDCCALWNLNNFSRTKTLFAKAGRFESAVFSPSGSELITLFQDGSVYFWNMDTFETEAKAELGISSAKGLKIQTSIESDYVVVAGNTSSSIFVCNLKDSNHTFQQYDLPNGCASIQHFKFFKNGCLCFVGSDQNFYVSQVGLGNSIVLKHSLPGGRGIYDFDINIRAETLLAVASTSEMFLYDLPKLISQQRANQDRLLGAGISADLVQSNLNLTKKPVYNLTSGSPQLQAIEDNQENRIFESKENDTPVEEVYVVQHGQPRQVVCQNSLNEPQVYRDTHKLEKLFKSSQIKIGDTYMDYDKLRKFLKKFKQYPDKHRAIIYKYLLKLPDNFEAYDNLVNKGLHNAFVNLNQKYPIESPKLYTKMQRILSALAHYCPVFSEVDFVPGLIFPFVKLFAVDEALCFEVILSFMIQWGQHLFEFFPNPPITMLQGIEDILKQVDFPLQQHLKNCDFGLNNYMWPPLQVLFTDMLSRPDWLCFIDFLVSYPDQPELLLYFVASFFMHFRDPLLRIKTPQELDIFLHKQAAVKIQTILDRALQLCKSMGSTSLMIKFENNLPLTKNQYPIFNFYPKFTIDHHARLRKQIQDEELQLQGRQNQIHELNRLTENLANMEDRIRDKEEMLLRADKDRRDQMVYEEEMRMAKKKQQDQQFRDSRLKHLTNIEKNMRQGLDRQQELREKEFQNINEEVLARKNIDNWNQQTRMEEEALQNLEFKSAARMNELVELRAREERQRKNKLDMDYNQQLSHQHDRVLDDRQKTEDLELRMRRDLLQQQKNLEIQDIAQENDRKNIENQLQQQEFLKDLKLAEVQRERKLRHLAEQDAFNAQEIARLKRQQREVLANEDKKHIQALLNKEKDNALQRANERLQILELEKKEQMAEIDQHRDRLSEIQNIQNRQELEQKIIEMRREAEKNILEEETRLQKMILSIEEEKRAHQQLTNELDDKEQQYIDQEEYYNKLRNKEDRNVVDERQHFEEFREQVREEIGGMQQQQQQEQSNNNRTGSILKNKPYQQGYQDVTMPRSLQQSQQQQQQQQQYDYDENKDQEYTKEDELLRRTQALRESILQQQQVKRIEEEYGRKPQQNQLQYDNQQQQFYNPQQSVKFSNQGGPGTQNQSNFSYSVSDDSKSKRSPLQSQQYQNQGILRVDQPYQYPSSSEKRNYYGQSSQDQTDQKEFQRYKPSEHYVDSEDEQLQQQQQYMQQQQPQQQQYQPGNQLTYSSGPSTANKSKYS